MSNICDIVRKAEHDYSTGSTLISKHVQWSLRENVEKIEAYKNSKHISGETDSLGREKPFFNIGTAASNVWFRATDLDRKNIKVRATKQSAYISSLLASIKLHEQFRKDNFGIFLNDWGRTLADYGSAVSKHVEKDGKMVSVVIPWNRLIVDSVDFHANPKIEKLYFTPAQLRENKMYDQKVVKQLIDATVSRKTIDGLQKDTNSDYIEVYEVHGQFDDAVLDGDQYMETDNYVQQMHVVSFVAGENGEYEDYTLYKGREEKDPYYITHLIPEDGRVMAIGSYERLFEAQWMVNHSMKAIKDQLDLASKMVFQTSDGSFVGQNILTDLENGEIMIHAVNQPLTQANFSSHDIGSLQAFSNDWQGQANKTAGISEAMMGEQKSGTAWRQTEALLQESHSLFELMTENKGLALEEIIKIYYIPFIKKNLNTTDEISATLSDYGVKEIERIYIKSKSIEESNNKNIEMMLSSDPTQPLEFTSPEQEATKIKEDLSSTGATRFIKPSEIPSYTWKELFKDLEWEIEIDVTGEQRDVQSAMTTLSTLYAQLVNNPNEAETARIVRNKILELTGTISPIELQTIDNAQQMQPMQAPQTSLAPIGGA